MTARLLSPSISDDINLLYATDTLPLGGCSGGDRVIRA
jgi:hypothetical protein